MRPTVAVVLCPDYHPDLVKHQVAEVVGLLGGIHQIVKPGQTVLVKPNLIMPMNPARAATTNPVFVESVVRLIQSAGAQVLIAESPGGPFNTKLLQRTYDRCGMAAVAANTGAKLNFNTNEVTVPFPEGRIIKSLRVLEVTREVDLIISLPKFKTHGLTLLTGAIKNCYGLIPGLVKAEYHMKMRRIQDFSELLVDVALWAKPQLTIMDAIVGMEGAGPTGGQPRVIGTIIAGLDPFAVDVAGSEMVGVKPQEVPVLKRAIARGLAGKSSQELIIAGVQQDQWPVIKDFVLPRAVVSADRGLLGSNKLPQFLARPLEKALKSQPLFLHETCAGCGDCVRNCPAQSLELVNNKPQVDLDTCISCFCCQELCPVQAVAIRQTWLGKKLFGAGD